MLSYNKKNKKDMYASKKLLDFFYSNIYHSNQVD